MSTFLQQWNSLVPSSLRGILPQVTYKQFLVAILIFTAIPYLIVLMWGNSRTGVYVLLCLQMVMLINVVSHCLMSLFLGGYSPGLLTALTINLPFSLYLLSRAWVERWVSRKQPLHLWRD